MEEWRVIELNNNYEVSNYGNVRNRFTLKLLKITRERGIGYCRVGLWYTDVPKTYLVHRLVAMAFLANPDNLPQVNHKDENKGNNHVNNLEWVTSKQNANYGNRNKKCSESKKNIPVKDYHRHKISKTMGGKIFYVYNKITKMFIGSWEIQKECARALKLKSNGGISRCLKGKYKTYAGYIFTYEKLS